MVNQASAASGHEPAMTMPCGNIRKISFTKPPTIRFVAATFFAVSLVLSSAATHRPPDIVIFLTDDQSRLDASPYGSILRTSNMQRLRCCGADVHPRFRGVAKLRAKSRCLAYRVDARA